MPADVKTLGPFTPTIDTAVYQDGDRVGSVFEVANIVQAAGGQFQVVDGRLQDDASSNLSLELWLWGASPTMVNADNGVFDVTDANVETGVIKGVGEFLAAHSRIIGASVSRNTPLTRFGGPPQWFGKCESGQTSVWGIFKARGAYDAAATDDLKLWLDVIRYS